MTIERIPNQQDLSWFIDMYNGKKLELNPPYQRRSVWTSKDRKFFLDTIFNNYPCPAIYLQKQINDIGTVFNVVDGKQRLQTVLDFYENKLRMAKDFPDPNLANKRWKDIEKNSHYRSIFLNYRFSVEQLTSDIDDDGWNSVARDVWLHSENAGLFIVRQSVHWYGRTWTYLSRGYSA